MKAVRKIAPKCETCRFFSDSEEEPRLSADDRSVNFGICRRRPPVPNHGYDGDDALGSFPIVVDEDWCGEWETKRGAS